jgi:hypothetical protein
MSQLQIIKQTLGPSLSAPSCTYLIGMFISANSYPVQIDIATYLHIGMYRGYESTYPSSFSTTTNVILITWNHQRNAHRIGFPSILITYPVNYFG